MTTEEWNHLTLFEQLSNIAGDVKRLIDTKESYASGRSDKDFSDFYFDKIVVLVNRTIADPKNRRRSSELLDEVAELERYRNNGVSKAYIMDYWNQYTKALSVGRR